MKVWLIKKLCYIYIYIYIYAILDTHTHTHTHTHTYIYIYICISKSHPGRQNHQIKLYISDDFCLLFNRWYMKRKWESEILITLNYVYIYIYIYIYVCVCVCVCVCNLFNQFFYVKKLMIIAWKQLFFQVTIKNSNNLYAVIWIQVFLFNTNNTIHHKFVPR